MKSQRKFDWDDAKAISNLLKHLVSFAYATQVFLDANMFDLDASKPEDGEPRRKAIGLIDGRLFTVIYTERDDLTRIISARRCNVREGKCYGPIYSRSE